MDTRTQHTPGPWTVDEQHTPQVWEYIIRDTYREDWGLGHEVARVNPYLDGREANARLIASAPALLAALEAILPYADSRKSPLEPSYFPTLDQARAAIALARGADA